MMEFIVQTYFDQLDGVRFAAPKATNPLAFRHCNPNEIVPCHRVIGHDGALTGYAGGLDRKQALLRLEGVLQPRQELLL